MEIDVNHLFFWEPIWFADTPFAVNRVVVLIFLASLLCMAFFLLGARRKSIVPRGAQNVAEAAYLFIRNNIAVDVIGPDGVRFAPYLAALFFFIFFNNLLEIVPGVNFPTTSRMALPAFLALLTWIVFNVVGFRAQGGRYLKETLFPPGVPKFIYVLLTPIELFSVFIIRPATLAIRLLANMMAGHVLLTVFFLFTHDFLVENLTPVSAFGGVLTFVVACVVIMFELLVISIQAYIFTMLTAFYIAESAHGHGPEDPQAGEHGAPHHTEVEGLPAHAA